MRKIPESAAELIESLEWDDYVDNRLISNHPSGFFVIIPKELKQCAPIFCSVCRCSLSSVGDVSCHDEFGCCEHCKDKFYYPNRERWVSGWRPTVDSCRSMKTVVVEHNTYGLP